MSNAVSTAHSSRVFNRRPSFRSASAQTLGNEPENWALPSSVMPANRPTNLTPSRWSRFRSMVSRCGEPTS